MKILINTPFLKLPGGVANHYLGLKDYWTEKVYYNQIGRRNEKLGHGIYWLPIDIIKFILKIIIINPDFVILNPSVGNSAIKRDLIFMNIAHFFKRRTVVFFHGFNKSAIKDLDLPTLTNKLNKCKYIFLLANEFAEIVRSWGVTTPIALTSTKVNDSLLDNFDVRARTGKIVTILFLARADKTKGLDITLKTFEILKKNNPYLKLNVCGTGNALEDAKKYVTGNGIKDVFFKGHVSGKAVAKEFKECDIYILPTHHHEGMATSVLEAMAFGLPVISRPVGGICDFFKEEEMGHLIESFSPEEYAQKIQKLIDNPELVKKIANTNFNYAKEHFLASKVAREIENILMSFQ